MRRLFLLIIVPFLLFTGLQAQTTQVEADDLVLEKMSGETRPYTIYAKEDIQPAGTVLTTSAGEIMVFEYEHWLYYVSFTENSQNNFYFVIKESNGSLLEVNVKNDGGAEYLETWRFVFKNYHTLQGTNWKLAGIFNSETGNIKELEPKNCDGCYTLSFLTDSTFITQGVNIYVDYARYSVNYTLSTIHFSFYIVAVDEPYDGNEYWYSLLSAGQYQKFYLSDTYLKLYFNDKMNYLLFKKKLL